MEEASGPNGPYPLIPAPVERDQIACGGGREGGTEGDRVARSQAGHTRGRSPAAGCSAPTSAGLGCDVRGRAGRQQSSIKPIMCHKGAGVQSFVLICAKVCGEGSTKNPGGSMSRSSSRGRRSSSSSSQQQRHQSHHVQQGCRGAIICAHLCKSVRGGQHEEPRWEQEL